MGKITIEISVGIGDDIPEHKGYYTSADMAKEAIDEIFEAYLYEEGKNNDNVNS